MLKSRVSSIFSLRNLPLLAILVLSPALARADDFSLGSDSSCSDPPIFTDIFTLPATNSTGGMCLAFGNHTGAPITSLKFTTTIPDANTDPMLCSGGLYFESCDYIVDTLDNTITVEFFGTNSDRPGIPVAPGCTLTIECTPPNNFSINLNNPICDPATGLCSQPTTSAGTGDWLVGGQAEVFTAAANGVPEPAAWALLLGGMSALLGRARYRGNRHAR